MKIKYFFETLSSLGWSNSQEVQKMIFTKTAHQRVLEGKDGESFSGE